MSGYVSFEQLAKQALSVLSESMAFYADEKRWQWQYEESRLKMESIIAILNGWPMPKPKTFKIRKPAHFKAIQQ